MKKVSGGRQHFFGGIVFLILTALVGFAVLLPHWKKYQQFRTLSGRPPVDAMSLAAKEIPLVSRSDSSWWDRLITEPVTDLAESHRVNIEPFAQNPPEFENSPVLPQPVKQVRIGLELHGAYDDLREFVEELPRMLPSCVIEEVELERTPVKMPRGDTLWESHVYLSINVLQSQL